MPVNINLCPLPASGELFVDALLRDVLAELGYETDANLPPAADRPRYQVKRPGMFAIDTCVSESGDGWIFLYRDLRDIVPLLAGGMIEIGEPTVPAGYRMEDAIEMVISHNLGIVVPPLIRLQRECRGYSILYEELLAAPQDTLEKALRHFGLDIDNTQLAQAIGRHDQSLRVLHDSEQLPGIYRQHFDVQTSNLFRIFLGQEQLALGYHMDDLPASPTPLEKGLSFFATHRRPYYISAQDYRHSSAGIRCLHYLCHALNQLGEEAYIVHAKSFNPRLKTPSLSSEIVHKHYLAGRQPIAVYPEVVEGNPLHIPNVARWLLNRPGHIGGDTNFNPTDEIFYFARWCLPLGMNGKILNFPSVDGEIFNNRNNHRDQTRNGIYFYANKYYASGGQLSPEITGAAISLGLEKSLSPEDIANILRTAEVLYCYELTSLIPEALSCGCPVLIVPSDYWTDHGDRGVFLNPGIELASTPNALAIAKAEVRLYRNFTPEQFNYYWWQVERFIQTTQDMALPNNAILNDNHPKDVLLEFWLLPEENRREKSSTLASFYEQIIPELTARERPQKTDHSVNFSNPLNNLNWLNKREIFDRNCGITCQEVASNWHRTPSFTLLIEVNQGEISKLADTLDSLEHQFYNNWSLAVVSPLPAPEAVRESSVLAWHTVETPIQSGSFVQSLGAQTGRDWIIELPAGAFLDPLYLWRLADEIDRHPDIRAFFVDDYTLDADGVCTELRLKPGVNIEHLRSMDLAGPLCIRQDSWIATQGVAERRGSPWFARLLGIAGLFGWTSIRHIADTLICYHETFPSDPESCLLALIANLQENGLAGEIVPATGQSWNTRYPMTATPAVSIAILSLGQLDLLSRCLDSIANNTRYPNIEILIALNETSDDPELNDWLTRQQQALKTILAPATSSHATRCNLAVKAAAHDFVLLIREEAVIIQEKWLEELLRTALQPGIAAVSPCLISPGSSLIENAGSVFGLNGLLGTPYQGTAKLGAAGYLDSLRIARDVSALPSACLLVRKADYLAVDGMDEIELGEFLPDADLCLKLRRKGHRLIFQPLATVAYGGHSLLDIDTDTIRQANELRANAHASETFSKRWLPDAAVDPFWNPNLSLTSALPTPENGYRASWQYLPTSSPRILARSLPNAQGRFRITAPLHALHNRGLATECIWPIDDSLREASASEILRLAPDTVIVQHYLHEKHLAALHAWNSVPGRPFIVYALDDLLTDLAASNPFRANFPANSRARLKYALERCDRLVTSTDFLAESYRHFIGDIRVVPNRLEQEIWLPLTTQRRTGKKPRIGWAGSKTHHGDLLLLREVIEQTRTEADWIFFGMCPDEIRPMLAEYHPFTQAADYPACLAALNLDIAVAPLAEIDFNRGKSNLRLLEYGILGTPVVCTDIEPYRNSPAHCVTNTPHAWIKALRELIYDAEARERDGVAMRHWVMQNYLQESHLDDWLSAHLPNRTGLQTKASSNARFF